MYIVVESEQFLFPSSKVIKDFLIQVVFHLFLLRSSSYPLFSQSFLSPSPPKNLSSSQKKISSISLSHRLEMERREGGVDGTNGLRRQIDSPTFSSRRRRIRDDGAYPSFFSKKERERERKESQFRLRLSRSVDFGSRTDVGRKLFPDFHPSLLYFRVGGTAKKNRPHPLLDGMSL